MKKCPNCGKEYPDTAGVCELDGQTLVDVNAAVPIAGKPVKEYRRLPGRGMRLDGGRFVAASRSYCTLWMGTDHLLLVDRTGWRENYKRFYFRDIQAVIIRKTVSATVASVGSGIISLALLVWGLSVANLPGRIILWILFAVFALLTLVNLWRGPSCVTEIKTAVQTEQLPPWNRVRAARKGMMRIRPRLLETQGAVPPEELRASLEDRILRQTQSPGSEPV